MKANREENCCSPLITFLTGPFESKEPYECFESDGSNRPRMKDNNLFFYLKNAMIHSSSSYKRDAGFDAR